VRFTFDVALVPGSYFVNAGVLGDVGTGEVFLDRWIDAGVLRVRAPGDPTLTGTVDLGVRGSAEPAA
jgi:lipopolysaccharide transport system ATP-binding protein